MKEEIYYILEPISCGSGWAIRTDLNGVYFSFITYDSFRVNKLMDYIKCSGYTKEELKNFIYDLFKYEINLILKDVIFI